MPQTCATLRLISGAGEKAPACFLLEANGGRILLDLGEGPPPGRLPDVAGIGPVDALVISHGHRDHVGGLPLAASLGSPPVYATEPVLRGLPDNIVRRPLPIRGRAEILGIPVETGRDGHAPGGIWIAFAIGDGFIYTGDYSAESVLYAYDPPACTAATALIDCSYGNYQIPFAESWSKLAAFIKHTPLLLPVPANGRGPEIVLELARHGVTEIFVDEAMRMALARLAGEDAISLRAGVREEIKRLGDLVRPIAEARGVMLAAAADGASGATALLIPQFEPMAAVAIVFTGYLNPGTPAERLVESKRAQFLRWNVHPLIADTVALVRSLKAKTVIPAFCDRSALPALSAALAPAQVTIDGPIEI